MKRNDREFVFEEALRKIDSILSHAEVIGKQGSYDPQEAKAAGGAFLDSTVVVAQFESDTFADASIENQGIAQHVLLSMIDSLVSCQPLLLNYDWDGRQLRAVFNTTKKPHIDAVLDVAAKTISMTDIINYKIGKVTGITFRINVAIDYGRLFNIITDEGEGLWSGEILRNTEELISQAYEKRIVVSRFIYRNLKDDYQHLFKSVNVFEDGSPYHADIINIGLNNWLKEQKGKK